MTVKLFVNLALIIWLLFRGNTRWVVLCHASHQHMFSLPDMIHITTPHTFPQLMHTLLPASQPLHSFYARPTACSTQMHNLRK